MVVFRWALPDRALEVLLTYELRSMLRQGQLAKDHIFRDILWCTDLAQEPKYKRFG